MKINLNEPVKVKLTDWGKEIFYHQYDRVNKAVGREVCKPRYPTEDENGYTEFQLWCFMELYGEHMGMALPNVIKPLEIVYPERKRGKWVDDGDPLTFICDQCGYRVARYNNTNFCPNCGADMRGEQNA